jgi:hypothetical protein
MPRKVLSLLTIVSLLGISQLAAARPGTEAVVLKKEPLTEKDIASSTFFTLEQMTGLGILGLRILYEVSGAETFEEFSHALLTANILRLDRQLVLRSLYENDLEEIIQDFGYTEKQAKEAIHQAKEQLKVAKKTWEQRS